VELTAPWRRLGNALMWLDEACMEKKRERNRELLRRLASGESREALASAFGITLQRVNDIVQTHRHLTAVSPLPEFRERRTQKLLEW